MDYRVLPSSSAGFPSSQDAAAGELSTSPGSSKAESFDRSFGSPELPSAAASTRQDASERHPKGKRKRTAYVGPSRFLPVAIEPR